MSKNRSSAESPSPASNDIGDFLRTARQKKDYTLGQVAELLGLRSPQAVWDWENGKGSGIPAEMLLRLVKIYGISPALAYEHLMKFHQDRTREKVHEKFEQAKNKILGQKNR